MKYLLLLLLFLGCIMLQSQESDEGPACHNQAQTQPTDPMPDCKCRRMHCSKNADENQCKHYCRKDLCQCASECKT